MSEIFNDFFISVASEIGFDEDIVSVADAINKYNVHPSIEKIKLYYENDIKNFDFQTVDADTVMLMIKNLDSKKATGCDIPGKLIKVAHRELATPLCNLINHSMKLKCFPSIMKSAEVTPIYKNGKQAQKRQLQACQHPHCDIQTIWDCLEYADGRPFLCIVQWTFSGFQKVL